MSKRLNLFLPDDHWIFKIPQKDRAKRVKELLEVARKSESMINDIADIKKLLMSGNAIQPPEIPKNVDDADRELIMQFLGM